ncbi:MAG: hypothetical protein ACAH27_05550 [Xanthobacteraceae bacterium]
MSQNIKHVVEGYPGEPTVCISPHEDGRRIVVESDGVKIVMHPSQADVVAWAIQGLAVEMLWEWVASTKVNLT